MGYSWGFLLSSPADAEYDMTPAASWGIEGGQDDSRCLKERGIFFSEPRLPWRLECFYFEGTTE